MRQDGASERIRDGFIVEPKRGRERFIAIRPPGRKHYRKPLIQRHDALPGTGTLLAARSASMVRAAVRPTAGFGA
jgi:hypothetical protein